MSENSEWIKNSLEKETREMPENDRDMLCQIWYALVGTNGSGLFKQFQELKESVVTKDVCQAFHDREAEAEKKKEKKIRNVERILFAVIATGSFFFGDRIISGLVKIFGCMG